MVLGFLAALPVRSGAQESPALTAGSWLAVETLTVRDDIRVELRSGEIRRGSLRKAMESVLTLARKGVETGYARADIRRVYRLVPHSRRSYRRSSRRVRRAHQRRAFEYQPRSHRREFCGGRRGARRPDRLRRVAGRGEHVLICLAGP